MYESKNKTVFFITCRIVAFQLKVEANDSLTLLRRFKTKLPSEVMLLSEEKPTNLPSEVKPTKFASLLAIEILDTLQSVLVKPEDIIVPPTSQDAREVVKATERKSDTDEQSKYLDDLHVTPLAKILVEQTIAAVAQKLGIDIPLERRISDTSQHYVPKKRSIGNVKTLKDIDSKTPATVLMLAVLEAAAKQTGTPFDESLVPKQETSATKKISKTKKSSLEGAATAYGTTSNLSEHGRAKATTSKSGKQPSKVSVSKLKTLTDTGIAEKKSKDFAPKGPKQITHESRPLGETFHVVKESTDAVLTSNRSVSSPHITAEHAGSASPEGRKPERQKKDQEKEAPQQTEDQVTTQEASGAVATKKASGVVTTKKSSGEVTAKKSSDEVTTKESTDKVTTKKSSDEVTTKKASGKVTTKKSSGEVTAKKSSDKVITRKSSGEVMTKKPSDEVTKKASDEVTAKKASDEVTTKKSSDEVITQEAAEVHEDAKDDDDIKKTEPEVTELPKKKSSFFTRVSSFLLSKRSSSKSDKQPAVDADKEKELKDGPDTPLGTSKSEEGRSSVIKFTEQTSSPQLAEPSSVTESSVIKSTEQTSSPQLAGPSSVTESIERVTPTRSSELIKKMVKDQISRICTMLRLNMPRK